MTNPIVKSLYGSDEYYGEDGCCLTCYREKKKKGCLCYDMKCKICIFYVPIKYSGENGKAHCGYGDINAVSTD